MAADRFLTTPGAKVTVLLTVTAASLFGLEFLVRVLDLLAAPRAAVVEMAPEASPDADRPLSLLTPHPFLGWVHQPDEPRGVQRNIFPDGDATDWYRRNNRTNLFGHYSEISDYRHLETPHFVVGIFGGSVASDLSLTAGDVLIDRLEQLQPELQGSIRVVNFAMGGYKQPQQLAALTEAIVVGVPFDVVINLDGVNEVGFGERFARRGIHPLFPHREILTAALELTRGTPSWEEIDLMAAVVRHRRAAARWRSRLDRRPWLARSELARAVFGSLALAAERRAVAPELALRDRIFAGAQGVANLPEPCLGEPFACLKLVAEIWQRSSLAMAAIAAKHNIVYLHLLQPNQYVEGSKVLSDEEKAVFYKPHEMWAESIRRGYPELQALVGPLRRRGVEIDDLSTLFLVRQETLYRDSCCHLNLRGNRLLARAVADRIDRALDGVPLE